MTRLFTRLLSAAALLLGTHGAAQTTSGCTALYALTGGTINYVSADGTTTPITTNATNLNGAALDPITGNVYFFDRSNPGQNDLKFMDTDTGNVTLIGAVTLPTNAQLVGASFDNSSGIAKLYALYSTYVIQEVNTSTGAVVRTLNVNLPSTTTTGQTIAKSTSTSGDMVFDGAILYAVLNGVVGSNDTPYYVTLGAVPATGTTITGTSALLITNGGAALARSAINGTAINPVPTPYITYITTGNGIFTLNTSTGALTALPNASAGYTDLSDCAVAPARPVVTKSFNATAIRTTTTTAPTSSVLTVTITNSNPGAFYTTAPIVDTFPSGLAVAPNPGLSTNCKLVTGVTATATATPGGTSVTLPTNLRLPGPGSCTVTVAVTGNSRGLKTNTITATSVNTTAGNPSSDAVATLLVNDPITGTNVKKQRLYPNGTLDTVSINAKPKDLVEYCITATHSGIGYAPATAANITDTLNANLSFVTGSATQGYGIGQDLKITRNNGTPTYRAYGSTVNGQKLTVNIAPFDSSNSKVEVCFIAQVK
ncbi:hypothetical protein [Deinococcus sp. RM]|uniref:DUF7933 domain-containing protein n=1 Tax=Deinococcus sp. RM TaxID=2316359 RepID=UPI0011C22826|nr:hypothetical protein [Deinococcus sp. RM]